MCVCGVCVYGGGVCMVALVVCVCGGNGGICDGGCDGVCWWCYVVALVVCVVVVATVVCVMAVVMVCVGGGMWWRY